MVAEEKQSELPIIENHSVYRDPHDVRTIFQLLSLFLIFLSLLVLSAGGNAYQYWRRPDRIVRA